jgi:heptosyltransferase II
VKSFSSRPALTRFADYSLRLSSYLLGNSRAVDYAKPLGLFPRRLLIVKVHGMGDSVLVRAVIELLARTYPEVEIGVLTGSATRELMTAGLSVRNHGYDQKRVTPRAIVSAWRDVRSSSYEAVANFEQGSLAGTAFVASAGIKTHAGFVRGDGDLKLSLLSHPVKFRESDSMWQSFLRITRVLYPDLPDQPVSITLRASQQSETWAEEWWRSHIGDRTAVAMHLGCGPGMDFKRWPVSRFLALAGRIGRRWPNPVIILTGTTLERDLIRQFLEAFGGAAVDASNIGSIEKTALILKRCRLLVSNDTGVMHLSAAIGTPTVGLFGPTSVVQWAPLGPRSAFIRETKLPCSPCVNNYLNLMPAACTNTFVGQCMTEIAIPNVELAIDRVLAAEAANGEDKGARRRA